MAKGGSEREGEGGKVDSVVEKNKEERSREEKRRRLYELAAILAGTTGERDIEGGKGMRLDGGCGWKRWSHAAHVASARRRVRHS